MSTIIIGKKYLAWVLFFLCLVVVSFEVRAQDPTKKGIDIMITQSPKIVVKLEAVKHNTCNGESKGAINISAFGGYPPYKYYWSNSDTTQDVAGLRAGVYRVAVYDDFSCSDTLEIEITEPERLVGSVESVKDILCYGYNNGEINVSVTGGTPPYRYSWSNGSDGEDLIGVNSGRYSVLITDANLCQEIVTADVLEKPLIVRSIEHVSEIKCHGDQTGGIDINVSGGVPPYTYQWNSGQTTEDISNLPAGLYEVTVSDSQSCTEVSSTKVLEPDALTIAFDEVNNLRCNGDFGGSININVQGGKLPYKYEWSNKATTQDIAGIPAGGYAVKVTDVNGCEASVNTSITEPEALVLTLASSKNVSHHGGSDGSIDIEASGGAQPYKYKWSNESAEQDISDLSAGNYSVRVTDASGCAKIMNVTITEPSLLIVKLEDTKDVSCYGDQSGAINISVYGGVSPYRYEWSNGQTVEDISNLAAGTYSVTVTDANGHQQTVETEITQPTEFKAQVVKTVDIMCNGENTGSVDIDVEGGVQPYRYRWNNGGISQDLDNIPAGEYSVKVIDANNCELEVGVSITEPEPLVLSFESFNNIKCTGDSTGTIDILVEGGITPYVYKWNTGATTEDLKGLKAGAYHVLVTDANGCTGKLEKEITEPAKLQLSESVVKNADCNGSNTGSISLNIEGGVTPYVYSWNSGDSVLNISNKKAGDYSLLVTDANGCTTSFSKTITQPEKLVCTLAEVTNNSCYGDSKGFVNLDVVGGVEPYVYSWNNGASTQDIVNVKAGRYFVQIADANGCTDSLTAVVTENPELNASLDVANINCNGLKTGAVTLNVDGGAAPYAYLWSNGATTKDISGLLSGNYSVIITDAEQCVKTLDAQIVEPPRFTVTLESEQHLNCYNQNTGVVTVRVSGGVLPYDYKWSNGATTQNISNLPIGEYVLTATDAKGCVQTVTTSLVQPPKIEFSVNSIDDVLCNGGKEGSVDISVSGGVGPFTYQWSNGAATQDIQGVGVGNYAVKITDANGCVNTLNAEVKEPQPLIVRLDTVAHILCYGDVNGSIGVSVAGGVKPYTYSWSNGATTEDIKGLTAGIYTVTVVDANGCAQSVTATIREPLPLVARIAEVKNIACNSDRVGSISIEVQGGIQPYAFNWSNGSTSQNISELPAGTYSVSITDKNGCSQNLTATITQPPRLVSELIESKDVSCFNGTDGAVNVTVVGGTAPFSYQWSNGASSQDLSGVPAGTYSLLIRDARGCSDSTIQTTLQQPGLLQTSITKVTDIVLYGQNTGAIDISVSGGVSPYTYSWSNGAVTQDLTDVPGGNYSVQIVDKNGCESRLSATINQPPALDVKLVAVGDVNCSGNNTGSITIDVTGGVPPYTFIWNSGDSTQNITNASAGDYGVTVVDANGHRKTLNASIAEPTPLDLKIDSYKNILCFSDRSGEINVTVTGGIEPYTYVWNSGQTSQDIAGLAAGNYSLSVTDDLGCKVALTQLISQPDSFSVRFGDVSHIKCRGDNTGEVYLVAEGGVKPYSYTWNTGARTKDITNILAGGYSVKVSDANGCSLELDTAIVEPLELEAKIVSIEHNSCFSDRNGAINIEVKGGVEPYRFAWNNNSTTQNLSGMLAGDYSVNITDANGCAKNLTAAITQPSGLNVLVREVVNVNCSGDETGKIFVDADGGTKPYSYVWNNGATQKDLSNVPAGDYQLGVTDAKGCNTTISTSISEPEPLTAIVDTIYHVMCNGENKGMVDVVVTGGSRPYTYLWSNGINSEDLVSVLAGEYTLEVKDAKGCKISLSATVQQPEQLSLVLDSLTNLQCHGQETGSITVHAVGGVEPYQYFWNNGSTGRSLANIAAGEYSATVTDGNGCKATFTSIVRQPDQLIKTIDAITDIRCNGDSTGSINVTVREGVGPYEFEWSNGATTEDIQRLTAGDYRLTITEANGCESFLEATVEQPSLFEASVTDVTNVNCYNDTTGAVSISVSGGEEPYNYAWSNGAETKDIRSIGADSYSVMITDDNGCLLTLHTQITEPPLLQLRIDSVRNVKCCGDQSGAIFITALGGVKPYNFEWSNGATTEDIENLVLGVYTVNITDANGCTVTSDDSNMSLYEQVVSKGKFTTRDILFDVGKAVIKPESFITINRIATFMKEHLDISFRIDGHTDSDGSEDLNMKLSEDRARAIKLALIKFGIRENRLDSKGFGETKPIATNLTPEGKALNRRVEFLALTGTMEGTLIEFK